MHTHTHLYSYTYLHTCICVIDVFIQKISTNSPTTTFQIHFRGMKRNISSLRIGLSPVLFLRRKYKAMGKLLKMKIYTRKGMQLFIVKKRSSNS